MVNKKYSTNNEEATKSTTTPSGKIDGQTKIFLASPSDVFRYRKITKDLVDEFNELHINREGQVPYFLFAWETSKSVGFTEDYQKDIFEEFGEWCDIFILILWHKLGAGGTEEEYEKMKDTFLKVNPNMKLIVAHIDQPVNINDVEPVQLEKLRIFIKENEKNWALLGLERGKIKTQASFKKLLSQELRYYNN